MEDRQPIANGFTFPKLLSTALTQRLEPSGPASPSTPRKKYIIGVCAMDDKARSKPMRNILDRLLTSGPFEAIIFGDKCILDEDVKNWPACDFFISFFSKGFPLHKAIEYVKLRTPFCVNELDMQTVLWDRRLVLEILDQIGVPTPRRLTVDRDGGPSILERARQKLRLRGVNIASSRPTPEFKVIDQDTIQIGDDIITKPFVEKPVSGEDHNIHIYYHSSAGGGGRRLFRKVANKSSEFDPELTMPRTNGSFVYECFMDVDNAEDVKVYTIGENFAHAETRKSPVVDGHVRRNTDGKEIRYVTQLSAEEKAMASSICKVFGQRVCGFDLLRVGGKSYVIDVNGWSFVKGNNYYYNNCASILRDLFLRNARQRKLSEVVFPKELLAENSWRLKCFVSVFRHADRTPKQKMKFSFSSAPFRELLNGGGEEVIIRNARDLRLVSAAAEQAMQDGLEDQTKLILLKNILDKKSNLPGTKVQVKPTFNKDTGKVKLQVIVKWGGEFTHAAKHQSRDLGENLRKDLLIMNRQVLDDVKIYTSSERRVRATAEVFTQKFLGIREVPKDMLHIRKEMLDDSNAAKEKTDEVKKELRELLQQGLPPDMEKTWPKDTPEPGELVEQVIMSMRRLREIMRKNYKELDVDSIQKSWCCQESPSLFYERWEKLFTEFADVEKADFDPSKVSELYDSLKYDALHNRPFLENIFLDRDEESKGMEPIKDLYQKAKILFDFISPLEYGIQAEDRLEIGLLTSMPLVKQIVEDLESCKKTAAPPCTRLYFTKESHVHTLLNIVYLSGIPVKVDKHQIPELDYLTQITFELYERSSPSLSTPSSSATSSPLPNSPDGTPNSPQAPEYSLRVGFSPGAGNPNILDLQMDSKHCLSVTQRRNLTDHLPLDAALRYYKMQVGDPKYRSVNRRIRETRMLGHRLVVAEGEEEEVAIVEDQPLMIVGSPMTTTGVESHFMGRRNSEAHFP